MKPKISVIVPVYNSSLYLEKCLDSILRQTYTDIELVLVDDGSTDNSGSICEQYACRDKRIKVFHQRNRGQSAARNLGIKNATGDYMLFVDSDDEITPDCLETLAKPLEKEYYDFVQGNFQLIGSLENVKLHPIEGGEGVYSRENVFKSFYDRIWNTMPVVKLINLKFIRKYNLYFLEGQVHEDDLWSFQLACRAQSMYIELKQVYIYIIRSGSTMSSETREQRCDMIMQNAVNMWKYINSDGFIKKKIHINYINELILGTMLSEVITPQRFKFYYSEIADGIYSNLNNIIEVSKTSIKNLLFSFPFALPRTLGFDLFSALLSIRRKRMNRINIAEK